MKLPIHIRNDGFDLEQIQRTAIHALYRKSKGAVHTSYEVILIQRAKADHTWPNGTVTLKGSESYPPSSMWGRAGWSFPTLRVAQAVIEDKTITGEDTPV
jgi:hypothetical protein